MNGQNGSDSADAEHIRVGRQFLVDGFGATVPDDVLYEGPPIPEANPGDIVDAEIPEAARESIFADKEKPLPRDTTKVTVPTADEWLDFFSRIVLRTLTRWYINLVFRGIDEDELSEREMERLILTETERKQIAQPWAEYASKDKFLRKHGRRVVSLAGSIESLIVLGGWVARVNRIAAKHRPPTARVVRNPNVSSGPPNQNGTTANAEWSPGTDGGYSVYNPGTS